MSKIIANSPALAARYRFGFRRGRVRAAVLGLLAFSAVTVGLTTAAAADIIQIAAITFVGRSDVQKVGDVSGGTLTNATGVFYAPVPFATDAETVCAFALIHRDGDADSGIVARLMKKKIKFGGNPFTSGNIEMAVVDSTTAGTVAGVTRILDKRIKDPVLELGNALYYVELTVQSDLLEVLGVQIDVRSACP